MEKADLDALKALSDHWNKIEGRLKQAEQIREEVVMPAINELRYAGRRYLDAAAILNDPSATPEKIQEAREYAIVAKQYLMNADHDITDAICFFIHGEVNRMQKKYGADEMIRVYPEYAAFARQMQDANTIISGARETREKRAAEYSKLATDYIPPLVDTYHQLRFSETLALKRSKRRRLLTGGATSFGAIGTVYGFWDPIVAGWHFIVALF